MKHKIYTDEFFHEISVRCLDSSAIRFTKDAKTLAEFSQNIQCNPHDVIDEVDYDNYTLCDYDGYIILKSLLEANAPYDCIPEWRVKFMKYHADYEFKSGEEFRNESESDAKFRCNRLRMSAYIYRELGLYKEAIEAMKLAIAEYKNKYENDFDVRGHLKYCRFDVVDDQVFVEGLQKRLNP